MSNFMENLQEMKTFGVNDLDKYTTDSIENCLNNLSRDEVIVWVNELRRKALSPDYAHSEAEIRTALLLNRRLRSMRELKEKTARATKAAQPKEAPPSLDDLASSLGL